MKLIAGIDGCCTRAASGNTADAPLTPWRDNHKSLPRDPSRHFRVHRLPCRTTTDFPFNVVWRQHLEAGIAMARSDRSAIPTQSIFGRVLEAGICHAFTY
jgi:hypothetical protein